MYETKRNGKATSAAQQGENPPLGDAYHKASVDCGVNKSEIQKCFIGLCVNNGAHHNLLVFA